MKKILTLLLFVSLAANLFLFFKKEQTSPIIEADKEYPYLAKRIFLDDANDVIINFTVLRQKLRSYVDDEDADIGIYFQYLPTGVNINVGADRPFVAASLLKLPTAIKTQKLIEKGELKPTDKITIENEFIDIHYGELYKISPGEKMSVEELMKISLKHSDNTAHRTLFTLTGGSPVDFYENLDIPPQYIGDEIAITPRNYASILRSLYFSSYLSYDGSNKVLTFLTEISEGQDLRANIPDEVKIAQKIGIYEVGDNENEFTYSDCGIYYVPNRQYILCIMTNGEKNISSARTQKISDIVYQYVKDVNVSKK